jgi:phytoene dehydrogenase-like protein
VVGIRVEGGRTRGVVLGDDELLEAPAVASALDPRRTLIDLLAPGMLAPETEDAVTSWRARGTTALLWLALSKPPAISGAAERVLVVSSLDQLERTSDGLKYDRLPTDPWLDVRVWNESSAPDGKATVSIHVGGIPPRAAWTDAERKAIQELVLERLEQIAPGVGATIEAQELLLPCDIAERFGTTGGHLFHGELALDQLWVQRPSMALSRYATPIAGLYLCGSGSHPGGPYACGAGVLGARAILAAAR